MTTATPSCVGCGKPAPQKDGDGFISSSTGWRLTRGKADDGRDLLTWRCPECWRQYKALNPPPRASNLFPRPSGGGRR
jgi:hypothetical protein